MLLRLDPWVLFPFVIVARACPAPINLPLSLASGPPGGHTDCSSFRLPGIRGAGAIRRAGSAACVLPGMDLPGSRPPTPPRLRLGAADPAGLGVDRPSNPAAGRFSGRPDQSGPVRGPRRLRAPLAAAAATDVVAGVLEKRENGRAARRTRTAQGAKPLGVGGT